MFNSLDSEMLWRGDKGDICGVLGDFGLRGEAAITENKQVRPSLPVWARFILIEENTGDHRFYDVIC